MVALDRLPTPSEMKAHLDRHVAGQERAKRALTSAVYRHYLGLAYRETPGSNDRDLGRQHVLLFGPTGCGKTHVVKTLGRHLGVPVAFTAATSLVESGYSGEHVDSVFATLFAAAGMDLARAGRGIVFLDEFDKLRRVAGHGRDVSGEGVQNGLLAMLDGSPVRFRVREQPITLDASRVLFVCTGAFAGLADIVRARLADRGGLGFGARVGGREPLPDAEALARVTTADLVQYGFIPELVGRFATLAALQPLARADLVHILGGVEDSALARERLQFELHGVRLDVTPEACDALAARSLTMGTGARGLARLLHEVLEDVAWRLPELAERGVGCVRVDRGVVEGRAKPELLAVAEYDDGVSGLSAEELRYGALSPPPPSRVGANRLFEQIQQLGGDETGQKVRQLQLELGGSRLQGEGLATWQRFVRGTASVQLLWTLERLKSEGVPLGEFVEALDAAGTAHPGSLVHYAAYLHARRQDERARRHREVLAARRQRGRRPDADGPRLDV